MSDIEREDDCHDGIPAEEEARTEASRVSRRVTDILRLLAANDLHPTKKHLARVAECTDLATLDCWYERALIASHAKQVFTD